MTQSPQLNVRVDDVFLKRLDDWRREQTDLPGRPEAMRRLVSFALKRHKTGTKESRKTTNPASHKNR